jgi:hypothetical protein
MRPDSVRSQDFPAMRTTGAARVIDTAAPPLPRCEVGWDVEGNGNGTERGEAVHHTSRRNHSWNALLPHPSDGSRAAEPG